MDFYSRYSKLRDARNLRDARVAADTGIPKSNICMWKSTRTISLRNLIKLADYFDVSLDYLVGRTDNK